MLLCLVLFSAMLNKLFILVDSLADSVGVIVVSWGIEGCCLRCRWDSAFGQFMVFGLRGDSQTGGRGGGEGGSGGGG